MKSLQMLETGASPGQKAPNFEALPGVDGHEYSLSDFDDRPVLVLIFASNGCPTVQAYDGRLRELQTNLAEQGVQIVMINSNNPYLSPRDTLAEMAQVADRRKFVFPYLKDASGAVAKSYGAIATPHVFVLDAERRVRYRGRIDDSRDPARAQEHYLVDALHAVLAGEPVEIEETEPAGCAIVW